MRKALTAARAALTLGGAVSATAVTGAEARPYYHGGGYYHGGYRGNGGAAVVAGVAGLALGAALASNHGHYYGGYAGPGYYYGPPAPYYYGPATCYTTRWVWDPYIGRNVAQSIPYAC